MNSTCPLCGHALDATGCDSCPLGSNCPMVCCPACGYTTIDTNKTTVGKIALNLIPSQGPKGDSASDAELSTSARPPKADRVDGAELSTLAEAAQADRSDVAEPSALAEADRTVATELSTLAEAPEGVSVRVVAFQNTSGSRPLQMQAYGLVPGRLVQVLQHSVQRVRAYLEVLLI